jgi:D-alanine-D-alanine ligase
MKTIAVFFGGRSAEHDVSIITALTSVIKPLELTQKYNVVPVYIAKDGRWYTGEQLKDIKFYQSKNLITLLAKMKTVSLTLGNTLTLSVPTRLSRSDIVVDIAFPAMHGTYGEDGALMGLLDMANVPYVGCGVSAASVSMDKVLAKNVASENNIAVTKYVSLRRSDVTSDGSAAAENIEKILTYPLFVKPAHLGSSIGITKVSHIRELQNALEVAAYYDDLVIVEEAVSNLIELTLPIIGPAERPVPGLLERPLTHTEDFFDFDTKYMHGGKKGKGGAKASTDPAGAQGYSQIPADLPPQLYKQAESLGLAVYRALGCDGIARIDMLIDSKTGQVYFNEINPLPGSLYAHNWAKAGVSKVELVEKLVAYALERHEKRQKLATTFSTNFLQQF